MSTPCWPSRTVAFSAISLSLNAPFVALLARVGVQDLLGLLRTAGATNLHLNPAHYGLFIAVGGAKLTPPELAALYITLDRDRLHQPLIWREERVPGEGLPVLSSQACWLTRRALAQRDRPDFALRAELADEPLAVYYKTGTSAANRDAWATGSEPRHTAVPWLGNLDGTGSARMVGGQVAAPLLFNLL